MDTDDWNISNVILLSINSEITRKHLDTWGRLYAGGDIKQYLIKCIKLNTFWSNSVVSKEFAVSWSKLADRYWEASSYEYSAKPW